MRYLTSFIGCILLVATVGAKPKPDFIAYANHPWASCPLDIRVHFSDGKVTKIFKPYDDVGKKVGDTRHKEWYVGSVDCRGGRIAYTRYVMVIKERTFEDGSKGTYQTNSYKKVVITDLTGKLIRELGRDFGTECHSARLSPDGKKVAYCCTTEDKGEDTIKSRICLADIATGKIIDITPDVLDAWGWAPTWSPCGKYLAFFHNPGPKGRSMLVAYELATKTTRRLAYVEDPGWRTAWSSDGQSIVLEYERDDAYNRGAADACKVRLSRFNISTGKINHLIDCTTGWSECIAGVLPDGRVMFRAVDPQIAHRRYYSTDWNVILNVPTEKRYLMDSKSTAFLLFNGFPLSKHFSIQPVAGGDGLAPEMSRYPELKPKQTNPLPPPPRIGITTSVRIEKKVVHLRAFVPGTVTAQSLWWEDSEGNFYDGESVTVTRDTFDRAGGLFLCAVLQDGSTYQHFVREAPGAAPARPDEAAKPGHDFTATVEPIEGGLKIVINGTIPLVLRTIPAGDIITHSVYYREKYNQNYHELCFLYDEGYAKPKAMIKPHKIHVDSFFMGAFEVTQEQYKAVMGKERCTFQGPDLPVENVGGVEAEAFCKALSAKTGLKLRLPRLTEWKYAAKGGVKTKYYWGEKLTPDQCNYAGRWAPGLVIKEAEWKERKDAISKGSTLPVGSFKPNPYGLYDIFGNVAEMCRSLNGRLTIRNGVETWDMKSSGPYGHGQDPNVRYASMGGGWVHYGEMITRTKWFHLLYGYRRDWNGFRIAADLRK